MTESVCDEGMKARANGHKERMWLKRIENQTYAKKTGERGNWEMMGGRLWRRVVAADRGLS